MVPLALAHCLLQPGRQQRTNRSAFLGGENTRFPQQFRLDFQRNIGFHIAHFHVQHYFMCSGRRKSIKFKMSTRIRTDREHVRLVVQSVWQARPKL
jgi:hypothetical protein